MLRKTTIFNEKINVVIENKKAVLATIETFVNATRNINEDKESDPNEKIHRYLKVIIDTMKSIHNSTIPISLTEMTDAMKEAKVEVDESNDVLKNLSFQKLVSKSIEALKEFEEVNKNAIFLLSRLEKQLKENVEIAKSFNNLQDAPITFFGNFSEKSDEKPENKINKSLSPR